jgi:hypothetical protein
MSQHYILEKVLSHFRWFFYQKVTYPPVLGSVFFIPHAWSPNCLLKFFPPPYPLLVASLPLNSIGTKQWGKEACL